MAATRKDFVIYGASGYTGQYVVKEVARKAHLHKELTWAVAGRNNTKLIKCLKEAGEELGFDLSSIEVIIAETNDYDSLVKMAAQATVLLNCVGPYRFYGEPVVRACVENGTSHVDIAGEPEYLERMELMFNEKSKEAGCYVVGACGMDSIPNDMGIVYAKQKFPGKLAAVDTFLALDSTTGGGLNAGTWNTLVHSVSNWKELTELRKRMPKTKLPKPAFQLPKHTVSKFSDGKYYVPFMGADKSIVYRTQRDEYLASQATPINANMYVKVGGFTALLEAIMFGVVFFLMSLTSFGRSLLLKYPRFFSFGFVYPDGPPKEVIDQQSMTLTVECHGYSSPEGQGRPDKHMILRMTGPDPGYVATSTFLVESAFTILKEKEKLPGRGGVMTTGYAFKDTSLIERLAERNIHTEVFTEAN